MADPTTNTTAGISGKLEPTTYIVLRQDTQKTSADSNEGTLAWRVENSNVPASNAEAAIRLACKNDPNPAGTYVAVPARSWRPLVVRAEQTTVIRLEPPAEPT